MDELDSHGISWKYYSDVGGGSPSPSKPGLWNPLPAFESFKINQSRLNNVVNNSQFLSDLADGKLASVSWVIPNNVESEHAPYDVVVREHYIVNLVNAVTQSRYWNSTAIFITWDDYGGWYDHVPPP
jgi:phospholipase C